MYGCVFMYCVGIKDGPSCYTIARVRIVIMYICYICMMIVLECTSCLYSLIVNTRRLDECVFGPEQLNGVSLTEIIGCVKRLRLLWTYNNMMEITMVAVPYNGVIIISYTMPFILPYIIPFTAILVYEGWMNRITQNHIVSFTNEGRIVSLQFRNNGEMSFNNTIATASCSVVDMSEVSFFPDCIRIDTTDDKR